VEESASTFAGNAELKARAAAGHGGANAWALADDSGLEVDALNGAPGVYSARYAGPGATDEANVAKLLAELHDVPDEARTARFRRAMAPHAASVRPWIVDGPCEGRIPLAPRGTHGSGYDPFFFLPHRGCPMAELPPEQKNRLSHRAQALAKVVELLRTLL